MAKTKPKYIFVVGGVMSSVGKGICAASIANVLKARGFSVTNIKCDMYVNIDAGTIRPTEHGEVFVGEDGIEADQDLGNYERFTGNAMSIVNYVTTGQVYQEVIRKERNLEYGGEDVEVVPDVPNEIIRRIKVAQKAGKAEITIIEYGGTIGEYQVLLFLEAARIMKVKNPDDVSFVLVSYLPLPEHVGEMKTKPTQYAVRSLNAAGIQADFVVARGPKELDNRRREILAHVCNLLKGTVVAAPDVESIYEIPLQYYKQHFDERLIESLNLRLRKADFKQWQQLVRKIKSCKKELKIAIVGKYFGTGKFTLADSYISVIEAIKHACWFNNRKPQLSWVDSEKFERHPEKVKELKQYDGVIVPGGFGTRGVDGIIQAIKYVRENNIPYLGLCYGMQLASIEFARNVLKLKNAHSQEIKKNTPNPIIIANPYQQKNIKQKRYGATMRLGAYPCKLDKSSSSYAAYGLDRISERHRHRYEFNNKYLNRFQKAGMEIAGVCPDNDLVEIIELENHPWFVGVQFHPEFKSMPIKPHPLFREFASACLKTKK